MRILDRVTQVVLTACMAIITLIVFGQIVLRYAVSDVPPWTEEVARYIFAWIIFLGTPVAYRHRAHIVIDILVRQLSGAPRRRLDILVLVGIAIFLAAILAGGMQNVWQAWGDHSPVLQLSMSFLYLPLPVGVALTLVYVLADLQATFRRGAA